MKNIFLLQLIIFCSPGVHAQKKTVDTLNFFSISLQKNTKAVVIKPAHYSSKKKYPVLYLLHGYSGDYSNWVSKVPAVKDYATTFNMIVVCPNGENSWYVNEPATQKNQYEKFVSEELVNYIDAKYSTQKNAAHRAIAGLSMGGNGALTLGLKYPQIFGAAGSMSGAVDMVSLANKYNLTAISGDTAITHFNWEQHSALDIADSSTGRRLALIIDCGVNDIFIENNRALHKKLLMQKVPHDFIERAGAHNWNYWANSLPYQMLFFSRYFSKQQ